MDIMANKEYACNVQLNVQSVQLMVNVHNVQIHFIQFLTVLILQTIVQHSNIRLELPFVIIAIQPAKLVSVPQNQTV